MARAEKRTLEIRATLKDLLTAPLGGMDSAVTKWARRAAASFKNVLGVMFNMKTAVAGLLASFVSLSTVKGFADRADSLLKLAESTGDTVENLSELQAAFELATVKGEDLGGVLRALLTQARKAKTDLDLQGAFEGIGITLTDLDRLGPAQLFERMAAGLERYGTAQEKANALGKVLPKQFLDLLPILGKGLSEFRQVVEKARSIGATVFEPQAKIADDLGGSFKGVEIAIGAVSRALIEKFGPQAIAMLDKLAKGIYENRDGIVQFAEAFSTAVLSAINLATEGVIGFVGFVENLPLIGKKLIDTAPLEKEVAVLGKRWEEIRQQQLRSMNIDPNELTARFIGATGEEAAALQRRISELGSAIEHGLAGAMRAGKLRMIAELKDAANAVRARADGTFADEDNPADILRLNRVLARAQSTFQPPKGQGVTEVEETGEAAAAAALKLEAAAAAAARLAESIKAAAEAARKMDFGAGFSEGVTLAIEKFNNLNALGQEAANTLAGAFDGVSSAIVETAIAADGSAQAWKRLGLSAVADLTRIIVKLGIIKTLQAALGYTGGVALADGGVVEGTMGTPRKFARGGVTTGPTLALFGEGRNREAFVPLPDNRSIPVTLTGGGGGPTFNISITAFDGRDVQRVLVEQRETLMGIWRHEVTSRSVATRQVIQRASR